MGKLYSYIFLLLVLITACQSSSEEKKVVNFEEVMGETGEEFMEDSLKIEAVKDTVVPKSLFGKFVLTQEVNFDTVLLENFHPLDRFTYTTREKITFKSPEKVSYGDKEVNPNIDMFYYTFADSVTAKNAFYNWLDCFGTDCQPIKLEEEIEGIKTPPAFILMYDTLIINAQYRCEDKAFSTRSFEQALVETFGKKYKYQLDVGCGGPVRWK